MNINSNTVRAGDLHGRWSVLEDGQGDNKVLCRCVCGNESRVIARRIGKTSRSCNRCASKESGATRRRNYVGQRFGKLTVVERLDRVRFKVQCDCGRLTIKKRHSLAASSSCGCSRGKARSAHALLKYNQLIGRRFAQMIVTGVGANKKLCMRCDCGTEFAPNRSDVTSGRVKSCGHGRLEKLRRMAETIRSKARWIPIFGQLLSCPEVAGLIGCSVGTIQIRVKAYGKSATKQILAPIRADGPHRAAKARRENRAIPGVAIDLHG